MKTGGRFRKFVVLTGFLAFGCLSILSVPSSMAARAAETPVALPADQTQHLLNVLTDPQKRAQFISTLKDMNAAEKANRAHALQNATLLETLRANLEIFWQAAMRELQGIAQTIANFRALGPWLHHVWLDPALQQEIFRICLRVAIVGVGGFALARAVRYLLRHSRVRLETRGQNVALEAAEMKTRLGLERETLKKARQEAQALEAVQKKAAEKASLIQAAAAVPEADVAKSISDPALHAADHSPAPATAASPPTGDGQNPPLPVRDPAQETHNPAGEIPLEARADSGKLKEAQERVEEAARIQSQLDSLHLEIAEAEKQLDELLAKARHTHLLSHWRRIPYALGCFFLDLAGIAMFPLVALFIQLLDPSPDARTMVAVWSVTLFANVGQTLWVAILRTLLAPKRAWMRLVPLSDMVSQFLFSWLRRIGAFIAWGVTGIVILQACTLPTSVMVAIGKILGLAVHLLLAVMIIGARRPVGTACSELGRRRPRFSAILQIAAELWWIAALFFDLALWLVWAADIHEGYQLVLQLFLRTCAALIAARILWVLGHSGLNHLFHLTGKWDLSPPARNRLRIYFPAVQKTVSFIVLVVSILLLAVAWGAPVEKLFAENALGMKLASSVTAIVLSLLAGVLIWEAVNIAIDHQLGKLQNGDSSAATKVKMARVKTLQPLFRILLLIMLGATVGMTVLSELGVNITPLLASASIFGVALGFGSQKLVHDFISGVFLLMENALAVGDAVTLNGTYGAVEKLSLRTVHVRASDGSLNIFPFSSLNEITNYNRGFVRVMVNAEVAYDTPVQKVIAIFMEITENIKKDPNLGGYVLDDFVVWGLNSFNDSSITICGTLPVLPAGRWPITWEFNRQMCDIFNKRGIVMPFPTRTLDFPSMESFMAYEMKRQQAMTEKMAASAPVHPSAAKTDTGGSSS